MRKQDQLREIYRERHPDSYTDVVRNVMVILGEEDYSSFYKPDPTRIRVADDGDYQGTLLFIIGADGYQPDHYWAVKVSYGSCSGCDTLQSIQDYSSDTPSESQVNDYMTLSLHIVQGLKEI